MFSCALSLQFIDQMDIKASNAHREIWMEQIIRVRFRFFSEIEIFNLPRNISRSISNKFSFRGKELSFRSLKNITDTSS